MVEENNNLRNIARIKVKAGTMLAMPHATIGEL